MCESLWQVIREQSPPVCKCRIQRNIHGMRVWCVTAYSVSWNRGLRIGTDRNRNSRDGKRLNGAPQSGFNNLPDDRRLFSERMVRIVEANQVAVTARGLL